MEVMDQSLDEFIKNTCIQMDEVLFNQGHINYVPNINNAYIRLCKSDPDFATKKKWNDFIHILYEKIMYYEPAFCDFQCDKCHYVKCIRKHSLNRLQKRYLFTI